MHVSPRSTVRIPAVGHLAFPPGMVALGHRAMACTPHAATAVVITTHNPVDRYIDTCIRASLQDVVGCDGKVARHFVVLKMSNSATTAECSYCAYTSRS